MKVLLVDDSKIILRVLTNVVKKYFDEVEVFTAEDGSIAMRVLEAEKVDGKSGIPIMFLDWNMPVMNGEEVVDAVRLDKELNNLRIIMATTEGGKTSVVKMMKKGVAGYLVKPFQEASIHKTLDTITARMR
ncbi:MAG: response regulator [Helicobacteraceae bacterium]|nr:response regulator [Helicobacteraceae bacterium]